MALKFKLILFLAVVFVFLSAADVSFAASNCYWACGGSESLRCQGRDENGEGSDCDWVCDTSSQLICVDPENSSAICNLDWGCPNPKYNCQGKDKNGEGSDCGWTCQGSGPNCGDNGGGGGNCIPDGGSCIGQPGSACCSGTCDVRDREGEERADVCVGPPPPPAPTVDIQCNSSNGPCNINWNSSSNLSWSSSNANSCSSSGDWSGSKGTSGSQGTGNLTTPKIYNYTLSCSGAGGSANDAVNVVVSAPVPNNPSSVNVTQPDYCISGPAVTVNWTYSDPSGSPQQSYQVQVDEQASFNSPEADSGKVNSGSTSYFTGQGLFQFNTTYKARVRVWNGYDQVSNWTISSSFKTPDFAYPQINFTWTSNGISENPSPPIGKVVQFTDQSVFGGNQNQRDWDWTFGDSTSSTQQSPSKTYNAEGTYYVTLTGTDSKNQSCAKTRGPLIIQKPIPKWKEVAPR